jgi:hypothetical protein
MVYKQALRPISRRKSLHHAIFKYVAASLHPFIYGPAARRRKRNRRIALFENIKKNNAEGSEFPGFRW